ncbi:sigma-54-dependent Fis family transcriptional regulator [Candidatus Sumerlaeota bacterium]|nr:sigma-54-dependent Fis family transcriptional regulator [Candidatus Sumerlaeota bacterium]
MTKILIVDDDINLCRTMQIQLEAVGHAVKYAPTGGEGLSLAAEFEPNLAFLDLRLPDQDGMDCLKQFQNARPDLPVVIITGHQDTRSTIEAMRLGAFDYLRKPFDMDDLYLLLEKIKRFTERRATQPLPVSSSPFSDHSYEIVGKHKSILEVIKQIGLLSRSRVNVLIEGESGTGKELVARALHENACPDKPFVAINCSAVVATLLESELFGHERGAFTGADTKKMGKLEFAGDGAVFFDEIGDMPFDLQAKLLRVIEERAFERVGGLQTIQFRARVISATNQNLEELVEREKFRDDLFYRLSVFRIKLPPLRERKEDIPLIVNYLLERICHRIHRRIDAIEKEALEVLESYDWPGNIRELDNVLTRAVALSRQAVLQREDLERTIIPARIHKEEEFKLKTLDEMEKEYLEKALNFTGWNITQTSRRLNISPTTLRKKIADYGLKG